MLSPPRRGARADPCALAARTPACAAPFARLRASGETVVARCPATSASRRQFDCDRELVAVDGRWAVAPL